MLFLDTEFTGFHCPRLLSIGLVDTSGAHLFYGVIEDFEQAACSEFVREHVLPKLHAQWPACEKAAGGAFPASAMGQVLCDWLTTVREAQGGGRLLVVFDYWNDGDLFLEALGAARPDWIDVEDIGPKLPPSLPDEVEHELRHHALFDALRLRQAYVQAEVVGALGWP